MIEKGSTNRKHTASKMKLTKRKNSHYLLVKLNARDRKYLDGFRKHESAKVVKNTDKLLALKWRFTRVLLPSIIKS